jgi:hypothetical protein
MYAGVRLKRRFRKTGETRRGPRKACFWRPPPNSHRGKKLRYLAEFFVDLPRRQWPDEDGILVGGPLPRPKERTAKKLQKAVRSYSKSAAIEPF